MIHTGVHYQLPAPGPRLCPRTIAEVGFAEIDLGALRGFRPRACASYTRCFPEFLRKELFGSSCVRSIDNRHEHGENSAKD